MALRDKLRELRDAPADMDVLEFFGVGPGGFGMTADTLRIGGEAVSLAEAKGIVSAGPICESDPRPSRTVTIEDL